MPVTSPTRRHRPVDPGSAEEAEVDLPRHRGRLGRPVLAAVVVAMVAMWGYVLFLAFVPGRQPPVDRLEDPAFAEAAEARCAEAVAAVDELPPANQPDTAAGRAEVLDQANARFTTMVDDLDDLATTLVPAGEQRDRVDAWLADWRTLLHDRQGFAAALQVDPGARLLISEKGDTGRHVTGWIDEFANANRMESCATPTDV